MVARALVATVVTAILRCDFCAAKPKCRPHPPGPPPPEARQTEPGGGGQGEEGGGGWGGEGCGLRERSSSCNGGDGGDPPNGSWPHLRALDDTDTSFADLRVPKALRL